MAWPTQRQGHYYVGSGPTKGKVIKRLRSKVWSLCNIVITVMTHDHLLPCQGVPGPVQAGGAQGLEILLTEENGRDRDTTEVQ